MGRELCRPEVQQELIDLQGERAALNLTQEAWRSRVLMRIATEAIGEITRSKCSNWCRRVERYIPLSLACRTLFMIDLFSP